MGKTAATILVILAFVGVIALSLAGKACNTAERMADQTIFNADKHVWSYEEFHRKYTQYEQYKKQLADAQERLAKLEARNISAGQEYDNTATEVAGLRQMMNRIAADYNAMSQIAYQGIWKSKGLPERLE